MADRREAPIRVALIGYGLAGAIFHGPLVSSTPGMALTTIVTSDPERRARASGNHPDANVLTDVEALWERSAELDLVVVATPNRSHVPLGLAALEAGLHAVFIPHPMTWHLEHVDIEHHPGWRGRFEEIERFAELLTLFRHTASSGERA